MFELISLLEKSGRTIREDLTRWFQPYLPGGAYYLISDYCLNDAGKNHDVYAFEIVLNHDTRKAMAEYVRAVAPRDLKASRTTSEGLGQYLASPVTFSVNFVVARETNALRDYVSGERLRAFLPVARNLVQDWARNNAEHAAYFEAVDRRLKQLNLEVARKQPSDRLIRQIMLVAAFGAYVLDILDIAKAPQAIKWISDRDAMFDRHDNVAFDLAYLFWLVSRSSRCGSQGPVPNVAFGLPGMDGVNDYAELIRLPDYLAGTLADVTLPDLEFSHEKFPPIFRQVFVEASNNAVVQVGMSGETLITRRLGFGALRSAWQSLQPGDWDD